MKYQPPFDPAYAGAPVNGIYNADANAGYVNGNPATGTEGSIPPFEAVEHPLRELSHLITNAGLTPSHTDLEQVRKAVEAIVARSVIGVGGGTTMVTWNATTKKFEVRGLEAGSNVTLTAVESPNGSGQHRLRIDATGGAGGGGNPLANVGDGAGTVFKGFNSPNDELRSIKGLNGVVTRNNGSVVEVDGGGIGVWDFIAEDQKAQETHGGTSTTTYSDRDLNTVIHNPNGWTLSSNRVTLPAGTYIAQWEALANNIFSFKQRLFDHTNAVVLKAASSGLANQAASHNVAGTGIAKFTLAGTAAIAVQQISYLVFSYGHGQALAGQLPAGAGAECYVRLMIKKIA